MYFHHSTKNCTCCWLISLTSLVKTPQGHRELSSPQPLSSTVKLQHGMVVKIESGLESWLCLTFPTHVEFRQIILCLGKTGGKKCIDSTRLLRDLNKLIHVKCLGLGRLHSDIIINNHYYLKNSLHFLTLLETIINDLIARGQILDFHLRL